MTKKELIESMEHMAAACMSFQFAYSLYDGEDEPEQMVEIWDQAENIIEYANGQWKQKWVAND